MFVHFAVKIVTLAPRMYATPIQRKPCYYHGSPNGMQGNLTTPQSYAYAIGASSVPNTPKPSYAVPKNENVTTQEARISYTSVFDSLAMLEKESENGERERIASLWRYQALNLPMKCHVLKMVKE